MLKRFKMGGIHPAENKLSKDASITAFPLPETVIIPVNQHIGAPAVICVAKGDKVKVGQLIASASGFVSANIHSSVSGTVTSIDAIPDSGGVRRPAITIKVEGDEWEESIDRSPTLVKECKLSPKEIIERVASCGIVGMGGATFPTHVKLSIPAGKKAECLILNGVECEPYLTSDYRIMVERGEEILVGAHILSKALGITKVYIGIENNKPDAIAHLSKLVSQYKGMEVTPLKVQYPQGGEKQLIQAITGREVPSGGLPIDVGAVVQNVGTALAVYQAIQKNKPLFERVVTVTGKSLKNPSNYLVRIGTSLSALIEQSGGIPHNSGKIINGGPMMGRAISNTDSPVTKGTSGVLIMEENESLRGKKTTCMSCAKCVSACPMGLEPYIMGKLGKKNMLAEMEEYRALDCIECGSCSYICPCNLPLLDMIRLGKLEVSRIVRARNAAK